MGEARHGGTELVGEQPIVNIWGEKVALGPHRRELLPLYQRWINDFEVTRTLAATLRPMSWESEVAWYERIATSERDVVFTIYERASLRPVGSTGLHAIDHVNRTADFGIMIGEKDCWGQGYGTEAARLMLDYGFTGLGLHNILLRVYSFNERGIRAYTRAGFRVIGRRREAHHLGGRAYDVVLMDCIATEFESPVLRTLLP
jgi:RimJ/RimL family protein N-acetyltransferase